jgi:protein required for attachment to host cells
VCSTEFTASAAAELAGHATASRRIAASGRVPDEPWRHQRPCISGCQSGARGLLWLRRLVLLPGIQPLQHLTLHAAHIVVPGPPSRRNLMPSSAPPPSSLPLSHLLVADSGVARLMRVMGPRGHRVIEEFETLVRATAHLPARALTTDRTGRVFESAGRGGRIATRVRHGAASDYDPHAVEIERFIAHIVQRLQSLQRTGDLQALTLLAAPRFLGLMRRKLPASVRRTIVRQRTGDFVHANVRRILQVIESA